MCVCVGRGLGFAPNCPLTRETPAPPAPIPEGVALWRFPPEAATLRPRVPPTEIWAQPLLRPLLPPQHEQVQQEADRHGEELRATRAELSELQRTIHRLQADITALKEQRARLEAALAQAEEQGQQAVADVTAKLQSTTQALQKAKQHMARQMQEYHVLANLKLALDIEIATYSKLLEGEESRLESSR